LSSKKSLADSEIDRCQVSQTLTDGRLHNLGGTQMCTLHK
jgi:hypothetical protein